MHCGDTLLIPAPGSGLTPHLWIIVTEPTPDTHLCVIVNVTTLRNSQDQTVTLNASDHPFIRHPSVVRYSDARFADVRRLRADLAARTALPPTRFPIFAANSGKHDAPSRSVTRLAGVVGPTELESVTSTVSR